MRRWTRVDEVGPRAVTVDSVGPDVGLRAVIVLVVVGIDPRPATECAAVVGIEARAAIVGLTPVRATAARVRLAAEFEAAASHGSRCRASTALVDRSGPKAICVGESRGTPDIAAGERRRSNTAHVAPATASIATVTIAAATSGRRRTGQVPTSRSAST
jgi:hypothetical protein